jgi:hypothetical protein
MRAKHMPFPIIENFKTHFLCFATFFSSRRKYLTANTDNILRLEVTKILRIWLKKFGESHPDF